MKALGLILSLCCLFPWQAAKAATPVDVRIATASVASTFGPSDKARIVLHGNFPNSAFRLGPCRTQVDQASHQVRIHQTAFEDFHLALQVLTPFLSVVQVGPLEPGDYMVVDDVSGSQLAVFRVNGR